VAAGAAGNAPGAAGAAVAVGVAGGNAPGAAGAVAAMLVATRRRWPRAVAAAGSGKAHATVPSSADTTKGAKPNGGLATWSATNSNNFDKYYN